MFTNTLYGLVMNLIGQINHTSRTIASTSKVKRIQLLTFLKGILQVFSAGQFVDFTISVGPRRTSSPATSKIAQIIICLICVNKIGTSLKFFAHIFLESKINLLSSFTQYINHVLCVLQTLSTNIHLKFANTKLDFKI